MICDALLQDFQGITADVLAEQKIDFSHDLFTMGGLIGGDRQGVETLLSKPQNGRPGFRTFAPAGSAWK